MSKSLILFGSQTGNAEAISEHLSKKINIEFQPLSFIGKNIEMLEKYEYIYLIISTTGDGEPPNNALTFFRYLKKKKRNNYKLPNLKYSILALGSTDYSNFCKPGKDIYKLLKTMSATPLLDLYIADLSLIHI